MPLSRYRKMTLPQDAGEAISRNLDELELMCRSLEDVPFLDGELLSNVEYSGSAITVLHGLGRKWRGCIIVRRSSTEVVATTDANNPESGKSSQIVFTASGNVTFDAWVY